MNRFPEYSRAERIADRCVHAAGIILGTLALGTLALAARAKPTYIALGLVVYGCGLIGMLGCSALYNLAPPSPRKEWLRRVDHAAIYVMIAATYTPFALDLTSRGAGIGLLLFVWAVAACGVALKLAYPRRWERAAIVLYLVLGWCFLAVREDFLAAMPRSAIVLLLMGGVFYTGGAAIHHRRGLRYHNAIWHALVLIAAGCHFAVIAWLFAR